MARPTTKGLVSKSKLTAIADEIRRLFGGGTYTLDAIKTRLAAVVKRSNQDISVTADGIYQKVSVPAGLYADNAVKFLTRTNYDPDMTVSSDAFASTGKAVTVSVEHDMSDAGGFVPGWLNAAPRISETLHIKNASFNPSISLSGAGSNYIADGTGSYPIDLSLDGAFSAGWIGAKPTVTKTVRIKTYEHTHPKIVQNGEIVITPPTGYFFTAINLDVQVPPRGVDRSAADVTYSGGKVHIPAGYYASDVEITVPGANLGYQQFNTNGTFRASDFGFDGFSVVDIDVW